MGSANGRKVFVLTATVKRPRPQSRQKIPAFPSETNLPQLGWGSPMMTERRQCLGRTPSAGSLGFLERLQSASSPLPNRRLPVACLRVLARIECQCVSLRLMLGLSVCHAFESARMWALSTIVRSSVLALSDGVSVARSQSDGGISTSFHNAETPSSPAGQDAYENETLSQKQRLTQMLSLPNFGHSLRRQVQGSSFAPLFPSLSCPAVSRHSSTFTKPLPAHGSCAASTYETIGCFPCVE